MNTVYNLFADVAYNQGLHFLGTFSSHNSASRYIDSMILPCVKNATIERNSNNQIETVLFDNQDDVGTTCIYVEEQIVDAPFTCSTSLIESVRLINSDIGHWTKK